MTDHRRVVSDFDDAWPHFYAIHPSPDLVRVAGDLAEKHSLRGYDAVQLASAIAPRDRIHTEPVSVSTWDDGLRRAANDEGFALAHQGASN